MAISKQCTSCTTLNSVTLIICRKCSTPLRSNRYKVRVKKKSPEGKIKWKSKTVTSFEKAVLLEEELLREPMTSYKAIVASKSITLQANHHKEVSAVSFEAYYASAKLTKKSYKNDLEHWKKHVSHRDYQTTQGILEILGDMKDRGYAPATIRHVLTFIKRMYNWHIEADLLADGSNPASKIKLQKVDNTVTNTLSIDEVSALLNYLKSHDNRPMAIIVSLAVLTGRRQGELLDLLKEDIDLNGNIIRCRNTKNGKTLMFPMNDMSAELLAEAVSISFQKSEKVFPYTRHGFKTNWYRLRNKLLRKGLLPNPRFRFHDLRHTYATVLCNSGQVDIYTLQKLMGHSCLALTQRYAHLLDQTMRNATGVLDDILCCKN